MSMFLEIFTGGWYFNGEKIYIYNNWFSDINIA